MSDHEKYMKRCLALAGLGAGYVAPNPMVGAVLVHEEQIIGEGYHRLYGGPHAEVNCFNSVPEKYSTLIPDAILYVSLEPCAHFGKTPPCADLIIREKVREVIVGCRDPFVEVNGKGIENLEAAGVKVTTGVLEEECRDLNKRFFTFHERHRPYIVLKWAQTADGRIGYHGSNRLQITNQYSNRIVHKWRSEEAAILVGTNTAAYDNPQLTNRLWSGPSPVRMVLDTELRLPSSLAIFDGTARTIVFNTKIHGHQDKINYYQVGHDADLIDQVVNGLYQQRILSVIIEGGARLTQSFIDAGYWDEARVITNQELFIGDGVAAPVLGNAVFVSSDRQGSDVFSFFRNPS